jgi:AcrR family transcriptional regulator
MNDAPGKRESQKQHTRAAILRAAERLFADQGFHSTTVHAIAEAAGVTERTFFRYFASKADLVSADLSDWLGLFERTLNETDPGLPALVAIELAIQRALDQPGPVAGWLFPSDSTGKVGPRPDGLSGVQSQIAEIILRWRSFPSGQEGGDGEETHPIAVRRVKDAFRAAILARTSVGIVRSAIAATTRRAALRGESVTIAAIRELISEGFALVARSAAIPKQSSVSPLSDFF